MINTRWHTNTRWSRWHPERRNRKNCHKYFFAIWV